jgi:hypothetical protein
MASSADQPIMNQPVTFQVNGTFTSVSSSIAVVQNRLRSVDRYCNTYSIMRMRKALVMGASGFVGSHVTRQLVERGDDTAALAATALPAEGLADREAVDS